jgi:hypothetical protein
MLAAILLASTQEKSVADYCGDGPMASCKLWGPSDSARIVG